MVSFEEDGDDPPPQHEETTEKLTEILNFEDDEPLLAQIQGGLADLGHDPDLLEEYAALYEDTPDGDNFGRVNENYQPAETASTKDDKFLGYHDLVIKDILERHPEQTADPLKLQDTAGGDKIGKKFLDELRKYKGVTIKRSGNYIN